MSDEELTMSERAELENLRRWKAEAMEVMNGLSRLGPILQIPLGHSVTGATAIDAALDLHLRIIESGED